MVFFFNNGCKRRAASELLSKRSLKNGGKKKCNKKNKSRVTALQESLQLCVTVQQNVFNISVRRPRRVLLKVHFICVACDLATLHANYPHVVIAGSYLNPSPAPSAGRREGGLSGCLYELEKKQKQNTQNTVPVTWPRKQEGEVLFQDQSQEGGAGGIGSRHGPISLPRNPASHFCSFACQGAVARNKDATNRAHNVPNGVPSPEII